MEKDLSFIDELIKKGVIKIVEKLNDELTNKAFEYIDKGLSYNPKRLDVYFGKAHLYYLIKDYKKQFGLLKTIFELDKKDKSRTLKLIINY